MQDKYVQSIRYKLQKRVRRLNSAEAAVFPNLLQQFLAWFDSMPILAGIRDELLVRASEEEKTTPVERILSGEALVADNEVDAAALGYELVKRVSSGPHAVELTNVMFKYGRVNNIHDATERFRELFLEPFYEYIDEHIDDQQAILYFLRQYKHRCEWFRADTLRKRIEEDTQRGEKRLAYDLYEYLHDQGLDIYIEPQTASGIADFVGEQVGDARVVADAKIFWPEKSKGKSYLISAFHQAYTYARDFNEPFAYLVIFKMCPEDVAFLLPETDSLFPCLTTNNKTIFFVVIDACSHGVPASKRGALKTYEITSDELVQAVGETD